MKRLIRYNQDRIKKMPVSAFLLLIGLSISRRVFAQGQLENPTTYGSFQGLICGILGFLQVIVQPLGAIFIVIAGIKFVTARGNEQKVTEAKGTLLWAIIGIFVLFLGSDIIAIVADIIGITNGDNVCS